MSVPERVAIGFTGGSTHAIAKNMLVCRNRYGRQAIVALLKSNMEIHQDVDGCSIRPRPLVVHGATVD